jgi:ubiquitin-like modifier-activating enzyme 5
MKDFFPRYTMRPNPQCENRHCVEAAAAHAEFLLLHPPAPAEETEDHKKPIVHEDNEWDILFFLETHPPSSLHLFVDFALTVSVIF